MTGLPPALTAELTRLAGQLGEIQRRITSLERGQAAATLGQSSIEADGLVINDDSGTPQLILGQQADGTFAQLAVNAGPPPQCSDPLVGATIAGLMVSWDGHMADGTPPLADFAGVQVHCAGSPGFSPSPATLQSTLLGPGLRPIVGLGPGTTYYVAFVTVNDAGQTAPPSGYISGVPLSVPQAIPPGSITPAMVSFSITGGGAQVTFSGTAPASPATGDLWYDAAHGYRLNQWNGTAWTPYTFGTSAIAANSVTTSLLAAGAVTAANIAAGTVVAGIVDTTTLVAATLIGSRTLGYATAAPRGQTYYGFETGTQGWTATGGTVAQTSAFASVGAFALLLTPTGGVATAASSPSGTSGIPVQAGDPVQVIIDVLATAGFPAGYAGVRFYDTSGTFISETDSADLVFAAGDTAAMVAGDVAPADGYAAVLFGSHGLPTSGQLTYIDNVIISGNLAYSAAPVAGTDTVGNNYTQGLEINALPGLISAISIKDAWGSDTLAAIDSTGNVSGQVGTFSDVLVGGLSMVNDILPALPQGVIARTNIGASSLPFPATPTTSEIFLYELDVQMTAGRSYLMVLEPMKIVFSSAGGARVNIYATTDGSQPTSASPLLIQSSFVMSGSTGFSNIRTDTVTKMIESGTGAMWRILVSVVAFGTGSTPTLQIQQLDTQPGDDTQVNCRFYIYDMGQAVVNTGRLIGGTTSGSGSGTQNFTKTYSATGSHSYQGSDGGNPNSKINDNGAMYVGGDYGDTYNGHAKTWITFPASAISSDLSGATVTKVELYLNNNHTWYGSGMTVPVGWDSKSTFAATAGDPSGSGIDISEPHYSQGAAKWVTVPNSVGTNFASGAANTIVLYRGTNNLAYYGFFAGKNQSGAPQLRIHYSK